MKQSLYDVAPWLEEEFLEQKNGISIRQIAPHSNIKRSWKCKTCGYIWLASPATRVKGHGCPACSHLVATEKYNLATEYPELAAQWHPTKNGAIKPENVLPYSCKKVWWQCKRGHEWLASPSNRVQGRNCKQCSYEMKTSFPEQCIVYYLSDYFKLESRIKIDNWEADILLADYNIAIEYDGIAYHDRLKLQKREEEKNKVFASRNIDLIRIKESYDRSEIDGNTIYFIVNHKYSNLQNALLNLLVLLEEKTTIAIPKENIDIERDRQSIYKKYISYEKKNSFAENYPELIRFWNNEKNGDMKPSMFSKMSNKHVWWKCPECQGEWPESIINMAKGNRCPYCSNHRTLAGFNDLQTRFPDIAEEWDYEENGELKPNMFTPGSNLSVSWKCKNGHKWKKSISYRTHFQKTCPECRGIKKTTPLKEDEWLEKYQIAKNYYEANGDLLIPATYISNNGIKIGSWIRTQRAFRKNGLLSEKRISMLNEIGMVWEIRNNRSKV